MTQRVQNLNALFSDEPFSGEGVSLYATVGRLVQYRNYRVLPSGRRRRNGWIKGSGGNHDIANSVTKTARVDNAADPGTSIAWALPASFIPGAGTQEATFDVRRYNSHVENETYNSGTVTVPIDSSGDGNDQILGTPTLIGVQVRDGGNVRIRFRYEPSLNGIQPTVFKAVRTAGPTSPSDVSLTVEEGETDIEIDVESLSDASAYTYKITAENSGGTVTKDVLTGIVFTADATGPTAPTAGTTEVW